MDPLKKESSEQLSNINPTTSNISNKNSIIVPSIQSNRYSKEEIRIMFKEAEKKQSFDLSMYKLKTREILKLRNKRESHCFEELIQSYQQLLQKNKSLEEKVSFLDREQSIRRSSDAMKSSSISGITGLLSIGNNRDADYLQLKVQDLEKELNESIKENKVSSTKLFDIITENMKLKDNLSQSVKSNESKQHRINELDQILNTMDMDLQNLKRDISFLKSENHRLENMNVEISNELKIKTNENNDLIDQIIVIKNDYGNKMNELMEMIEDAKNKKEVADIYYSTKKDEFKKNNNNTLGIDSSQLDDFKVIVDEVKIPKKLKNKISGHNKTITNMRFNNFGSNMVSCGADMFIKNWDCSKNVEVGIFTGFSSTVTSACYDQSEQLLFAGSLDKTAKLWDLKSNKFLTTFIGHLDYINTVTCCNSSRRAFSGSSDRTIKEWDLDSKKLIKTYNGASACMTVRVSNNDSSIFSGHSDGTVKVWSVNSNDKPQMILDFHDDKVVSIEVLKNEYQLLTLSKDYSIRLLDLRKQDSIYKLDSQVIPHYCESGISASTDNKYFTVGSTKGQVYIFDLEKGVLEHTIDNKSKAITTIQWRPYHSQIYVGDASGLISIWGV